MDNLAIRDDAGRLVEDIEDEAAEEAGEEAEEEDEGEEVEGEQETMLLESLASAVEDD